MSSTPKYLRQEESLGEEFKEFLSTLPRDKGWFTSYIYQYQGFWCIARYLKAVISIQKNFVVQDSDVFLITFPKSGTTWLKAIMFTLLNRKRFPVFGNNHPLLTQNSHDLVPFLELDLYTDNMIPNLASFPSPRIFASHTPHLSLPQSVKNSPTCKLVYLCRNPKDNFVSFWHFYNKLRPQEMGALPIGEAFELFCKGICSFGPYWKHVLEYWKESQQSPEKIFFLKYEEMREKPGLHLQRLAKFLNCPFSGEEEESGVVEQILKLCSFDHLSTLEVNKNGTTRTGVENCKFYRKGEVGDWKNHLSDEMVEKLDEITQHNFFGSGLQL